MDSVLKRFTQILCGTLDNQAQIDRERKNGQQIHPYAKHVTAICNHKIINRPKNHEGIYILEESYYLYPERPEMELKPLLFYVRTNENNDILLQSIKIPGHLNKSEVTNANNALVLDYNDLKPSAFGIATYAYHEPDYFTVNHQANMGNGITFQLIETLSDAGLNVMELVKKDGQQITPYDTPLEYRRVAS